MWGWLRYFYLRPAPAQTAWVWALHWDGDVALLQCLPASQRRASGRSVP